MGGCAVSGELREGNGGDAEVYERGIHRFSEEVLTRIWLTRADYNGFKFCR